MKKRFKTTAEWKQHFYEKMNSPEMEAARWRYFQALTNWLAGIAPRRSRPQCRCFDGIASIASNLRTFCACGEREDLLTVLKLDPKGGV